MPYQPPPAEPAFPHYRLPPRTTGVLTPARSPMSDELDTLKSEDLSNADRPPPPELPISRCGTRFSSEFVHAAGRPAKPIRLIDDAIVNGKLIAVFTQRRDGRGAAAARSPGRHRHAHPQDVRRPTAAPPDRPGPRAAHAERAGSTHFICARVTAAVEGTPTQTGWRSTRSRATSRRTSSRSSRSRRCCPTICRRWP